MESINWEAMEEHKIIDGLYGKFFHSNHMTIARWRFEKGTALPVHSHPHEQITMIIKGALELEVGDEKVKMSQGDVLKIDGHIPHGGIATQASIVFDIFHPVREDFQEKYG